MKKFIILLAGLMVVCMMNSCKLFHKAKEPIDALQELAQDVTENGDDWDAKDWDDAASYLEEIKEKMPSQLNSEQQAIADASVSSIKEVAVKHEFTAKAMLVVLDAGNETEAAPEEKRVSFSTVDDSNWDTNTSQM